MDGTLRPPDEKRLTKIREENTLQERYMTYEKSVQKYFEYLSIGLNLEVTLSIAGSQTLSYTEFLKLTFFKQSYFTYFYK